MSTAVTPRIRVASAWGPFVWPIALGVVLLAAWQLAIQAGVVSGYALPSPVAIAGEFAGMLPAIASGAGITGLNTLYGLVAGSILAPVLNTMFGADSQFGRQVIAGIATFTPVFLGTLRGLRQARPVHRDLMRVYAASGWQAFRTVTLPTATPYVLTGIRIASSLAVISALVAEYFGGPRGGLGGLISTYAAQSAYARSWAFVVGAILLGVLFYAVTAGIEKLANTRLGAR